VVVAHLLGGVWWWRRPCNTACRTPSGAAHTVRGVARRPRCRTPRGGGAPAGRGVVV